PTPAPSASQTSGSAPTAAPTTNPTSTQTTSPAGSTGCPVAESGVPGGRDPWGGCFPGPGNTGVPAGTTLHSCATTIPTSGTYDACQFDGSVAVKAQNVRITRSLIKGQVTPSTGLVISDSTIACGCWSTSASSTPTAIMESNFTLLRVD